MLLFLNILRDHKQQHSGYDTYTVKAETPIQIEGKAAPRSVKTYQYNSQVGTLIAATVEDGQKYAKVNVLLVTIQIRVSIYGQ